MPSLLGTDVTTNYLKAISSTQFGTRRLSVINIAFTGADTTPTIANSLFSQAVRALQQTAEVWAVFTPASDNFKAIIATHTQWQGTANEGAAQKGNIGQDGTADDYGVLEAAILAGNGVPGSAGTAATVTNVSGFGQILA
jgi:hypothetical protein